MFPNFKSLSQREQKRMALLKKAERDLENDDAKRQAYSEAMWTDDVEKNKIRLPSNTTTTSTQTSSTGSSSSTQTENSSTGGPSSSNGSYAGSETAYSTGVFSTDSTGEPQASPPNNDFIGSIAEEEMESTEEDNNRQSIADIESLYEEYPYLAIQKINPIDNRDRPNNRYFLGKSGKLHHANGKLVKRDDIIDRIDWKKTLDLVFAKNEELEAIRQVKFDRLKTFKARHEKKREDEIKDTVFGKLYEKLLTKYEREVEDFRYKAEPDEASYDDVFETVEDMVSTLEKENRYSNLHRFKAGSERDIRAALETLIVNNRTLLKKNPVVGITRDGFPIGNGYKFDPETMQIVSIKRKVPNEELTKQISWKSTLEAWIQKLINNKASHNLNTAETNIPSRFEIQKKRGLGDSAASNPSVKTRTRTQSNPTDVGYHHRIKFIFDNAWAEFKDESIPVVVRNMASGKYVFDGRYVWSAGGLIHKRETGRPVEGEELNALFPLIAWGQNFTTVKQILMYMISATNNPNQKASHEKLKRVARDADNISLGDTRLDHLNRLTGLQKIQLTGRGLMGAGKAGALASKPRCLRKASFGVGDSKACALRGPLSPLDSSSAVPKSSRSTCKNLREIEGSGTASDLKYKRLGSKFIRVEDLHKNRLKLVFPNRTPVGKLRDIDPKLSQLINKLVFEKDIDQQLYGQLSISDKKLFCEILKATHLQHQFSNALDDPIESLKAEFDKLLGQIALGNDNPDLIRELKTMTVDLYSQKLITEDDFRNVMLNI